MSKKIIKSPVARFPGHIVLYDPITYPQLIEWRDNNAKFRECFDDKDKKLFEGEQFAWKAIFAVAEEVTIKGFESKDVDKIPSTPLALIDQLLAYLISEVRDHITKEEEVPNS